MVSYVYDAWGRLISTDDDTDIDLGEINPLRYRGYVYDQDTGLYYLQSRYYNPTWGRFINADSLVSTGQGILGNNMFAYCLNNPTNCYDPGGRSSIAYSLGDDSPLSFMDLFFGFGGGGGGDMAVSALATYAVVAEAGTIAVSMFQTGYEAKDDTKEDVIAAVTTSGPNDIIIYRYYASNTSNLAPRPGKDFDGLSFSTKPPRPGVEAVATTINTINATGVLLAYPTSPSHVVVVPAIGSVELWMLLGQNSIWTQILSSIVLELEG